jgi:hypothetical protein
VAHFLDPIIPGVKQMHSLLWSPLCSIFLLILFSGCVTLKTGADVPQKEYPVILYVSSENGGLVNPVNISVTLDNKNKIVDQDCFASAFGNNSQFKLTLTEGRHQFVADSKNGDAGLDVIFSVDRPIWLYLTYWGKNHFQLYISYQAMMSL